MCKLVTIFLIYSAYSLLMTWKDEFTHILNFLCGETLFKQKWVLSYMFLGKLERQTTTLKGGLILMPCSQILGFSQIQTIYTKFPS